MVVNLIPYALYSKVLYLRDLVHTLNNLNISTANQLEYPGIIISENTCAPDLKRLMCKLYANVNMIIRKFAKCSPGVKCFLFKFYMYFSNLYCVATRSLQKLNIIGENLSHPVAQLVEQEIGNLTTLVRVHVEPTRFYRYNCFILCNDCSETALKTLRNHIITVKKIWSIP